MLGKRTTIPIVLHVAADSPKFDFGGTNRYTVTNEDVFEAEGGEISAWLAYNNIVEDSYKVYKNGEILGEYGKATRELVLNNTNRVVGENVLEAVGGETSAFLAHGRSATEDIAAGSYSIYLNGTLLSGAVIGEEYDNWTTDYIINLTTGELFFSPENVTNETVVKAATSGQTTFTLSHENIINIGVVLHLNRSGNWILMNNTNQTGNFNYSINCTTGAVTLLAWSLDADDQIYASYTYCTDDLVPGARITADYSYFDPTIKTVRLHHQYIVPQSYKIYKNGVLVSETLYKIDLKTGNISFGSPIGLGTIEADYSYGHYSINKITGEITFNLLSEVVNETFIPTTTTSTFSLHYNRVFNCTLYIWDGTIGIWKIMLPNNKPGKYNYTIDKENGIVTLNNWTVTTGDSIHAFYHFTGLSPGDSITADYTYRDGGKRLFSTDAVFGGGDWRFYYVEIPDGGLNRDPLTKFFVNLTWDSPLADVDVVTFGPEPLTKMASGEYDFPPERYGPYVLQNSGGSTETASFFTATGGPHEYSISSLSPGLNVIGLHSVLMSASSFESVQGQVGNVRISTSAINVVSNKLSGSYNVRVLSSLDWEGQLSGVAAGPSAPVRYTDMLVYQDDPDWSHFRTFQEQLASGNTSLYVTLKDCLIFDVHIYGHEDAPDLDLGIFLDENGDGITQDEEFVAFDADGDADEHVKLIAPKDGNYIIRVYGFTLKQVPAHYDIDITTVQGLGFAVEGIGTDTSPEEVNKFTSDTPLPAFAKGEIEISWDLAGVKEGVPLMGAMYIGPGNGPMCFLMPIDLAFDFTPPTVEGVTPQLGAVTSDTHPTISAAFSDWDRGEIRQSSLRISVDDVDVTSIASISVPLTKENEIEGYWGGTIIYTPPVALSEGAHVVKAYGKDLAGNVVGAEWSFTVDTVAPSLSITDPSTEVLYTISSTCKVRGQVERGATLEIYLGSVAVSPEIASDGTFAADIDLFAGLNEVRCTAIDAAGHKTTVVRSIYYDTEEAQIIEARVEGSSVTNQDSARLAGKVNKEGSVVIDGKDIDLMSDLTFSSTHALHEGLNTFEIVFTDLAGNRVNTTCSVTRDTIVPEITIEPIGSSVSAPTITITGSTEANATVSINGKHVMLNGTSFSDVVALSYGVNTIVVQSRDRAGNIAEKRLTVAYEPEIGTNYAVIALLVALLIIGLLVGALVVFFIRKPIAEPSEEAIPEEIPAAAEELPPIPPEEAIPEELPEVEGMAPTPPEEAVPEGAEVPPTEVAPEAVPKEKAPAEKAEIPPTEVAPVEVKEEEIPPPEEMEPAPSPPTVESKPGVLDPVKAERLEKIKKAYEEGRISKELYEKNVKRVMER
ncbi:MAG: hypothetical protein AB1665_08275 [Candidatus Thermoplasmatota archaeon]